MGTRPGNGRSWVRERLYRRRVDVGKQSQGWPQFIAAYIDMRLNRYICGNTAENVSDHVLRYLPFDHSEVETDHAE